jgi:glutathione peroxidase
MRSVFPQRATAALAVTLAIGAIAAIGASALALNPGGSTPAPATPAPAPDVAKPAAPAAPKPDSKEAPSVLDLKVNAIDGTEVNLADYRGKVVLIVNVASKCGFTKQYAGLQELFDAKKDKGLVILGFPANNFGNQEPGSDAEISSFCESKFGVKFPMFAKISVAGADQHELYKRLAAQPAPIGATPRWNFTKFLLGRDGQVVARFDSNIAPNDAKLVAKVDELLAAPASGAPAPATPKAQ